MYSTFRLNVTKNGGLVFWLNFLFLFLFLFSFSISISLSQAVPYKTVQREFACRKGRKQSMHTKMALKDVQYILRECN